MMNSEARKRLEEGRPAPGAAALGELITDEDDRAFRIVWICTRCGSATERLIHNTNAGTACLNRRACDERVERAKACLEPVTQA